MNHELEPQRCVEDSNRTAPMLPWRQDRFCQAATLHAQVHRYATALWRRGWVFVLSLLVIGGPAVYLAVTRAPKFQSEAMMWVTDKLNLPGERPQADDLAVYIGTQAELIKSHTIQFRAFEKVKVLFPEIAGATANIARSYFPFELSVRSSQKNSVLVLLATGSSPEATKAFLDAIMDEYVSFKKDSRNRNSSEALSNITYQINDVQKQIQQQQNQLTLFQMSNSISYLTEHGLSAGSHLSKLVELLSDLRTEQHLLELLTPAQLKGLAQGSQVTLSDTELPGEKAARALALNTASPQAAYYQALQQIEILKAKRDEFARVLRPTHSKMVKLNQEIAGLEQLLKKLQDEGEERALAQMANRKKFLELQIENLESQYRAWETNAGEASRKLTDYDRIKQNLQRSQDLYDRLLVLQQTADLNHSFDQQALVPVAPASLGHRTFTQYSIAAAGLFLSLLLGVGAFAFLESLDDRFRSVRELSLHFRAEVVGQIPKACLNPRKGGQRLVPAASSQPAFAESFRNLRSSLLFMPGKETQPKVILVTSAIPREGKTTVSANLAVSLAKSGSRVLLIDADFRRGSINQIFGVGLKPGLLEVLREEASTAQAIVATGQPGLFVLPAGESVDSSSDAFLRSHVDLLLHDLAAQYRYIVIDVAPVLATDDAACLGPNTDGVFMVVRASYTSARATREALDRLRKRNVRVLGMIYNGAPASSDYYCRYNREYYLRTEATRSSVPGPAEGFSRNARG